MGKPRKPPATDWKARKIDDWTVTTFKQYLIDQHRERFGLPYICNNWGMHQRQLKLMIQEHGKEVTKEFIDLCFSRLKPRKPYNCLGFIYLFSYFRERFLNQAILNVRTRKEIEDIKENKAVNSSNDDWF